MNFVPQSTVYIPVFLVEYMLADTAEQIRGLHRSFPFPQFLPLYLLLSDLCLLLLFTPWLYLYLTVPLGKHFLLGYMDYIAILTGRSIITYDAIIN